MNLKGPWRRRVLLALALVAIGVAAILAWPRPAPPRFAVWSPPYRSPGCWRDRIESWIPRGWAWAQRLEQLALGKRKPINLNMELFAVADGSDATLSRLSPKPADYSSKGLRAWLLDAKEIDTLRATFKDLPGAEAVSRPRIGSADGIHSTMYVGHPVTVNGSPRPVGVFAEYVPLVRRGGIDLFTRIEVSKLVTNELTGPSISPDPEVQTNLSVALRIQVPKGRGLFLLGNGTKGHAGSVGMILDPPQ
jgi:hypothetical protein